MKYYHHIDPYFHHSKYFDAAYEYTISCGLIPGTEDFGIFLMSIIRTWEIDEKIIYYMKLYE